MSTMGHNMPPLSERLELDHASLASLANDAMALEGLDPIMGDDDLADYSERAKTLKGVVGQLEKARKVEKDQILKDGRTVDDFFKKLSKPIADASDAIVGAINAWQRKKLEEQRRREREEAEAAAALQIKEEPVAPAPVKEVARVVSSTGRVTASAKTFWTFELIDLSAVPARYLMVDEGALKDVIAAGVRDIPGVRIYEDVRTAIR